MELEPLAYYSRKEFLQREFFVSKNNSELRGGVKIAILLNMKTILVDAVDCIVMEDGGGFGIFREMRDLLETFPNRKIVLTGANDEQFKKFGLDKMPYEIFTLKHNPEKTDQKYYG